MIPKTLRKAIGFISSAILATWLLVFVGVWSMVATFIPQGDLSLDTVGAWAAAHPLLEPVVRVLGLHRAFTSYIFVACALVLGLSTAICAWRRTRVALSRGRTLRKAATADATSVRDTHDLEIAYCADRSEAEVLSTTSEVLEHLGVRFTSRDGLLRSVSSPWSTLGSPIFHWALVALIAVILLGSLQRSDGLMGVALGSAKPDVPTSYGVLHTGVLGTWGWANQSVRLDAFDLAFRAGGIDRGPTPMLSVLDGAGRVIKTQRVYPNMPLQVGALTIHPSDYGLSTTISLVSTTGVASGTSVQFVDFSKETSDGTAPVGFLVVSDDAGNPQMKVFVTVPLDRSDAQFDDQVPKVPKARFVVTTTDGRPLVDQTVGVGGDVLLPRGDSLRLDAVGYYARLSVVHDATIPLIYGALFAALIGLTITLLTRQQVVLAAVSDDAGTPRLFVALRLWRNAPTSRAELEKELVSALGGSDIEEIS